MKLSDLTAAFSAPFPAHEVKWRAGVVTKDKKRAMMLAYVDARVVRDRLIDLCPDDWTFKHEPIHGTPTPTVKGSLTICGVTREDVGEANTSDAGTYKAAVSDALKRCAVQFGIGRYLYELPSTWAEYDEAKRQAKQVPQLPEWALPEHERTPGGAHVAHVLEQLRAVKPLDLELQREMYKHLKSALAAAEGRVTMPPASAPAPRQQASNEQKAPAPTTEAASPSAALQRHDPASKEHHQALGAHAKRAGANTTEARAVLWGHLLGRAAPVGTHELTKDEAADLITYCVKVDNLTLTGKLHDALAIEADRRTVA